MNNDYTFVQVMGGVENNSFNSKLNLENHEDDENNQIQINIIMYPEISGPILALLKHSLYL